MTEPWFSNDDLEQATEFAYNQTYKWMNAAWENASEHDRKSWIRTTRYTLSAITPPQPTAEQCAARLIELGYEVKPHETWRKYLDDAREIRARMRENVDGIIPLAKSLVEFAEHGTVLRGVR